MKLTLIILVLAATTLAACERREPRVPPTPAFKSGDMVRMRAFGNEGMIVSVACWQRARQCEYAIRFSAIQLSTNVSLFGRDGPVDFAPIALVRQVQEFELEAVR